MAYARKLKPHHRHLIIDQSLLVPLLRSGMLEARTYDVLAHSLPVGEIQQRLDEALQKSPSIESLNDFRIGGNFVEDEYRALKGAGRVLTAHCEIYIHLSQSGITQLEKLDWTPPVVPALRRTKPVGAMPVIGFPGNALPRKGVVEIALAAGQLGWSVLIGGKPYPASLLWHGVDVQYKPMHDPDWLNSVDLVALPAFIEHRPDILLKALASGIPTIASRACGLPDNAGYIEVRPGDMMGLVTACRDAMSSPNDSAQEIDAH